MWIGELWDAIRRFLSRYLPFLRSRIRVFGKDIVLRNPIEDYGHEEPFAKLIEVGELHFHSAKRLSPPEIEQCASALLSYSSEPSVPRGLFLIFVFTDDGRGTRKEISFERTHAFSLLTAQGDQLEHHYFEKTEASTFAKVDSLSTSLSGRLDLDDVRLLHFAGARDYELFPESTIYEFALPEFRSMTWSKGKDHSLRLSLLQDLDRSWGATTLGLYGEELYESFLGVGISGSFCGGNRDCPKGNDKLCGYGPAGPDKVCGGVNGIKGDLLVTTYAALSEHGIDRPLPLDYRSLRGLQKKFLARFRKGREYISYYAIAAVFARYDLAMARKYAQALPHVHKAVQVLLEGSDEEPVVTSELREVMLDIISEYREVGEPVFQRILDVVEKDLNDYRGMSRGRLVESLEGPVELT